MASKLSSKRPYIVRRLSEATPRIVCATSAAQAVRYVTRAEYVVESATARQIAELVRTANITIEEAGVDKPDDPELELEPAQSLGQFK